jgi:hypothetical protein
MLSWHRLVPYYRWKYCQQHPSLLHDQIVESLAVDDSPDFFETIQSKTRTHQVLEMIVAVVETIKIATVSFVSILLFVWGLSTDCYDCVSYSNEYRCPRVLPFADGALAKSSCHDLCPDLFAAAFAN